MFSATYVILSSREKYKKFAVAFRERWKEMCLIVLCSDIITLLLFGSIVVCYYNTTSMCTANKVHKAYVCMYVNYFLLLYI
jgi:hypothetical protein